MRPSPSLSLAFPALSLLVSLSLAACGGRASSENTTDGGSPEATPAPGGGVCCPIVGDPCSACGSSLAGGWAASAAACGAIGGPCDGKIGFGTDDHGCQVLATGDNVAGASCCGCPISQEGGGNPTCTDAGATWTCPPAYGGSIPACPATATPGAACTVGSASCFACQQGAGIDCSCDASPDGGSAWLCVGAEVACE